MRPNDGRERHRNREDFDSISERPQNHNPELIHTKWCSRTGNRRARTRRTQRDHFTSPRRTRKNRGLSKALGSSAAISCSLSNHQNVPNSIEAGDIYTRNNPSSWVWKRNEVSEDRLCERSPRDGFAKWSCLIVGLQSNVHKSGHNSLLGSPNDEPFVGCESRLEELSSYVQHAPRNFVN